MNPDLTDMKAGFEAEDPNDASGADDSETEKPARRSGRRKIKIEYIEDKNRRHITFSKRKAGIMKKVRKKKKTSTLVKFVFFSLFFIG